MRGQVRENSREKGVVLIFGGINGEFNRIEKILRDNNYATAKALNLESCLRYVRSGKIALVLLHVTPIEGDHDLCRSLKNNLQTLKIPIIALASQSTPEEVSRIFELGEDDCLRLPVKPEELLRRIEGHLNGGKSESRLSPHISGSLSAMPLTDIFQFVELNKKSGILVVRFEHDRHSVFFDKGLIIAASSSDPNDHIWPYLVRDGKLSVEELKDIPSAQMSSAHAFGRFCLLKKMITEEELTGYIEEQTSEIIYNLLLMEEGTFHFYKNCPSVHHFIPVRLNIQETVLKGLKRKDEIGNLKIQPLSDERLFYQWEPDEVLTGREGRIARWLDGSRNVREVFKLSRASERDVSEVLHSWLRAGKALRVGEDGEGREAETIDAGTEEHVSLPSETRRRVQRIVEKREEVERELLGVRNNLFYEVQSLIGSEKTHLQLSVPLSALVYINDTFTMQEWFTLSRIDGTTDFKTLMGFSRMKEEEFYLFMFRAIKRGLVLPSGMLGVSKEEELLSNEKKGLPLR